LRIAVGSRTVVTNSGLAFGSLALTFVSQRRTAGRVRPGSRGWHGSGGLRDLVLIVDDSLEDFLQSLQFRPVHRKFTTCLSQLIQEVVLISDVLNTFDLRSVAAWSRRRAVWLAIS
jgi:hypothetical protein